MQLAQAVPLDILTIGAFEQLPVNVHKVEQGNRFSAVFCDETAKLTVEALTQFRINAAHDLFPIYWFGENPPEFVDGAFPNTSHQFLHEATRDAYDKCDRISKLAQRLSDDDRESLNLLGYLVTRQCDATPGWSPMLDRLVHYPRLRPEFASRNLLSQLFRQGLLEREYWRNTHQCRKCGSSRLNVAEHCPECRSTHLEEMDIVHHFSCGHQGPQEAFLLNAGGRMVCPSCEQNLDHFGVDYDKPGRVEVCRNCQAVTEDPTVCFECLDCETLTPSDEAPKSNWYQYRISPAGREAVMRGHLPLVGLETSLGELEPSKDYATFTALLDNGMSTASRYGRPFSVAVMRLLAGDEDDGVPPQFSTAMRETLIKLLREILRDSDFLYAAGQQVVFVFPETDAHELESIIKRIDTGLLTNIANQPDYQFEDWSDRSLRDILRGVRNVR